jgi:hypothetical protein
MQAGRKMTQYQIQLRGHLDRRWEANFPSFTITHQFSQDGQPQTLMAGTVNDQAALYGTISRLRNLGVELIGVYPLPEEEKSQENEDVTRDGK